MRLRSARRCRTLLVETGSPGTLRRMPCSPGLRGDSGRDDPGGYRLRKPCTLARPRKGPDPGAPIDSVAPVGDVDGDGSAPGVLCKWAIPNAAVGADVAPAPDSLPPLAVICFRGTGARWKASSRLVIRGRGLHAGFVNHLGRGAVGRGLALVICEATPQTLTPSYFRSKTTRPAALGLSGGRQPL